MFEIGKLFHVVHVGRDLDAMDKWYDEVFGVHRFYKGFHAGAMRDASLVCIGDFVMEPLVSAKVPGVESSAIAKFYARFGPRLQSIAWYVDSVEDVYRTFRAAGYQRIYDVTGKPMSQPPARDAVYPHPKDTFGALEFAMAGNVLEDPRLKDGWSSAYWRDQHPLGIERASHLTVLVGDMAKAKTVYRDVVGGKVIHEETKGDRKSAYLAIGEDTVVELAQPLTETGPTRREMDRYSESLFSVTFKVKDLDRAAAFLQSKSVRVESRTQDSLVMDREDAHGAVLGLTRRTIPGDERR